MLLNCRMASIPCSSRQSISYMKDLQQMLKKQPSKFRSQPATTGLQYFNMRVTQRLHRYRSLKRQWQEIATSVQNTSLSPNCPSPVPQDMTRNFPVFVAKTTNEPKSYCINDYINSVAAVAVVKDYNEKTSVELDPLHSRIQQDLLKLRKFIKAKQRKTTTATVETTCINAPFDDQENQNIPNVRKSSSLNKLKPLERVKIAGCQMRPPVLPKSESTDSGLCSTSNTSSTCSQYSKQQQQQQKLKRPTNTNKTFNIYSSRLNPPPPPPPPPLLLPSDSLCFRSSCQSKKKLNSAIGISPTISSKQIFPIEENKQPSFVKQELLLPPIQQLSDNNEPTTRPYTYATSTSASLQFSTALKRNTSLLPILLQSSLCVGVRPRETPQKKIECRLQVEAEEEEEEEEEEDDDEDAEERNETDENNEEDDYYHLLNYNHLISRLPKPIISIRPRYGQDEYGILFEQLDHIRETMPDTNIYDDFARIV